MQIIAHLKEQAENIWKDGIPKKWYFAVPSILIWILIIVYQHIYKK